MDFLIDLVDCRLVSKVFRSASWLVVTDFLIDIDCRRVSKVFRSASWRVVTAFLVDLVDWLAG